MYKPHCKKKITFWKCRIAVNSLLRGSKLVAIVVVSIRNQFQLPLCEWPLRSKVIDSAGNPQLLKGHLQSPLKHTQHKAVENTDFEDEDRSRFSYRAFSYVWTSLNCHFDPDCLSLDESTPICPFIMRLILGKSLIWNYYSLPCGFLIWWW